MGAVRLIDDAYVDGIMRLKDVAVSARGREEMFTIA